MQKENWLLEENMVKLLVLLEQDVAAADAYVRLATGAESLRKAWVRSRINIDY